MRQSSGGKPLYEVQRGERLAAVGPAWDANAGTTENMEARRLEAKRPSQRGGHLQSKQDDTREERRVERTDVACYDDRTRKRKAEQPSNGKVQQGNSALLSSQTEATSAVQPAIIHMRNNESRKSGCLAAVAP